MRKIRYRNGKEIHHADDCLPLLQAVANSEMELHALGRHSYPGVALKKSEAPGICSLGYWRTIGEQRRGLPSHRNEGVELTMSMSGMTPVTVEGKKYSLQPGELLVTRPWQAHSVGSPVFASGQVGWLIVDVGVRHPHQEWQWPEWVMLNKDEMQFLTRALRENEDVVRAVPDTVAKTFQQLVRIATQPDASHRGSRIVVAVNALLLELFDLFETSPVEYRPALTEASRSIRIFLDELPERMAEPWSVQSMADACGLGVTHFTRHFQLTAGESPARYLLALRLTTAARRLRDEPDMPVAEIAHQTGFPYATYFSRVFAQRYGCTAAHWRSRKNTP
jgi:AraC family L-rhamnose operon regulatory protein RhaS